MAFIPRRIDVYHHTDSTNQADLEQIQTGIQQLIGLVQAQGAKMTVLSDAVDALQARISEDVDHLLALLADANARAEAAAANDAADAATITALQEANAAAVADAQATADRINSIDPVADFPGVPEEPTP